MDNVLFMQAAAKICHDGGIGTLGEKTLHAVIKQYLEPDASYREIKVGGSVADIFNTNGITEIQTRCYEKLRKKLPALFEAAAVTVVLPLPHLKWLSWIDPSTGAVSPKRKSPKTGRPYDGLYELAKLRPYLTDARLTVHILMIDLLEYRNLDGWGHGGKRGSSRNERIPLGLAGEFIISTPGDYRLFIPDGLADNFTLKEYMKAASLSKNSGCAGLYILRDMGIVRQTGKRGRENLYTVCQQAD